jgi:hypothetical protein
VAVGVVDNIQSAMLTLSDEYNWLVLDTPANDYYSTRMPHELE